MIISLFKNAKDEHPRAVEVDWDRFCNEVIGTEHKHYLGDKLYIPAFSPVEYPPGATRGKASVTRVWLACLDFDDITKDQFEALVTMLDGYRQVIYTSYSHQGATEPNDPVRVRVVLDLTRPLAAAEWPRFWANFTAMLPAPCDIKCKDASRIYFLPYAPDLAKAQIWRDDGKEALEVDAILARTPTAEATGKTTELDKTQPLTTDDLERYAKRLERRAEPNLAEMGRWLLLVAKGEAYAMPGTRHNTVLAITAHLERNFPNAPIDELAALFEGSLTVMGRTDPTFEKEAERRDITSALAGMRQRRLTEAAARAQAFDEAQAQMIKAAFRGDRTEPYSETELDAFAAAEGTTRAGFNRRWIVQYGSSYYIFVDGQYRAPVGEKALFVSAMRDLAPAASAGVTFTKSDGRGMLIRKTRDDLLADYGTVARQAVASMIAPRSYYNAKTQTLYEAVCPPRIIPPIYSTEVDTWLKLLAGDKYPELCLWLKLVFDLNEPLAAVYFEGVKTAGKSLFARAVSRIWGTSGAVDAKDVTDGFNDMALHNPIVFADEYMPPAWDSRHGGIGRFRQFIATRDRALNRKYLARVPLEGCTRLILAANNKNLVKSREMLTENDRDAIVDRLFSVHCSKEAADYLKHLGRVRVRRFVDNDEVAAHAYWLRDNLTLESQGRFGVAGHNDELHDEMTYDHPINACVGEWLIGFILDPDKLWKANPQANRKHALIEGGQVYVNLKALNTQQNWQIYVNNPDKVPRSADIAKALSELSTGERVCRKTVMYRLINVVKLAKHAESTQLSTQEEIARALSKDHTTRLEKAN